ncbi:MAG: HlyC/CorC family transporter [Clostridia bacterium]|nr:HlyC/CorC family transporter [Clostridia bacterium]
MLTIFWQLVLQFVLIGLNAFFACAEIAVISVGDARLAQLIEQGNKKAEKLAKVTKDSARFLAVIQVAITLSGFFGSAFAADNFSEIITDALYREGGMFSRATIDAFSVIAVTLILSYFTLVLGELVPKRLAMKRGEELALSMAGTISVLSTLFRPIVALLSFSTNVVLRLFGIDPNAKEETEFERDIKDLVDQGSSQGEIDSDEREIIHNIFEFDEITVGELATHRTELSVLYLEDDVDEWHKIIVDNRHSYYPVCNDTVDEVVGVLSAKDYFALDSKNRDDVMKFAVRPANFVPAGVRCDVLFKKMKQTRNHFAVIVDEYGGTTGIATMNDLLAKIVGDFDDVDDGPEIESVKENVYEIVGSATLGEAAEALDVELPLDEFDTFGGYIMSLYGSVPEDGEAPMLETADLVIDRCIIEAHRVISARVTVKEKDEEEE